MFVYKFLYGEDGLEVTKTSFLGEKQLPFLLKNQRVTGCPTKQDKLDKSVEKYKKKVRFVEF